jgi:hypothetical protein
VALLFHGTTLRRALAIVAAGPDPGYVEPGGDVGAENFSACLTFGPFKIGKPEEYACRKARTAPDEDGPALVIVEVPEDLVALAVNEWFPLSQGFVQFDLGAGLEELRAEWARLEKRVMSFEARVTP